MASERPVVIIEPDLQWVRSEVLDRMKRRFYGRLVISFEAGRVTLMKVEETLKPPPGAPKERTPGLR